MDLLKNVVVIFFLASGCFFILVGAIGVLRFPDFYCRLHSAGKCDTLGQALILVGLILYQGLSLISVKLLFLIIFIFIANPTATHALCKAAYLSGIKPWKKE